MDNVSQKEFCWVVSNVVCFRYTSTFVGVEVVPLLVVELLVVLPSRPRHEHTVENEV